MGALDIRPMCKDRLLHITWDRLPPDTTFIKSSVVPNISVPDKNKWGADSANMAYVLFQKPSMVAVHAQEMLEDLSDRYPRSIARRPALLKLASRSVHQHQHSSLLT